MDDNTREPSQAVDAKLTWDSVKDIKGNNSNNPLENQIDYVKSTGKPTSINITKYWNFAITINFTCYNLRTKLAHGWKITVGGLNQIGDKPFTTCCTNSKFLEILDQDAMRLGDSLNQDPFSGWDAWEKMRVHSIELLHVVLLGDQVPKIIEIND